MSLAALTILNQQRADMIELDPSSETFNIVGGPTFIGIFDDAYEINQADGGNVSQRSTCPAIMVSEIPDGLIKGTIINREDGDSFTWRRSGTDSQGVNVIWLY